MKAYDEAVARGEKHPAKVVANLKLPGFFPGCCYESKWGKARRAQNWDLIDRSAPKMSRKFKEVPNSLRKILNYDKLKNGDGSNGVKNVRLPLVLQEVVEGLVMDRIQLGEECNI